MHPSEMAETDSEVGPSWIFFIVSSFSARPFDQALTETSATNDSALIDNRRSPSSDSCSIRFTPLYFCSSHRLPCPPFQERRRSAGTLLTDYREAARDIPEGAAFHAIKPIAFAGDAAAESAVSISVDETERRQTYYGMGTSFDRASMANLLKMSPRAREEVLRGMFDPEGDGLRLNIIRYPLGTSDFTGTEWYTYNDLPKGETDPELDLRKTLQAFAAEGIEFDAITVQNEPEINQVYPSSKMSPETVIAVQAALHGEVAEHGVTTSIWTGDTQWSKGHEYHIPQAEAARESGNPYVTGAAWHWYGGNPKAMRRYAERFPGQLNILTEIQLANRGRVVSRVLTYFQNGAQGMVDWITGLDRDGGPLNPGNPWKKVGGGNSSPWIPTIRTIGTGRSTPFNTGPSALSSAPAPS
ncbi:MAG: hypothetical protein ACLFTU_07505 [Puniceicoccaceae bacterium]